MFNDSLTSAAAYEGRNTTSFVAQTANIINRFRHSIIRSRKERLLDGDLQAADNILKELHFTELMAKDTLNRLTTQGNSMERTYILMNQLEKQIKDIADDLNEVNGGKCFGACANGRLFGFALFGCVKKRRKQKSKRKKNDRQQKQISANFSNQENLNSFISNRWSSDINREESLNRIRNLTQERRESPDFVNLINRINNVKEKEIAENEKDLNKFRDYLVKHYSLFYGYIDQSDSVLNEIDLALNFKQLNTYLDHLLQITNTMTNEIDKHNLCITKIETQAMESGNLLTDYTLLGSQILDSSTKQHHLLNNQTIDPIGMTTGQKILLKSVL